jgi:tripartite-type tricarboxylate transporter receptor subunit TctC
MNWQFTFLLAAGALAAPTAIGPAVAEDWPARPLTMVIGTAAGGGTDPGERRVP